MSGTELPESLDMDERVDSSNSAVDNAYRAAAAAAIQEANAALRRPHLARLDREAKRRVWREVIRRRLHARVQRELRRHTTRTAAVHEWWSGMESEAAQEWNQANGAT